MTAWMFTLFNVSVLIQQRSSHLVWVISVKWQRPEGSRCDCRIRAPVYGKFIHCLISIPSFCYTMNIKITLKATQRKEYWKVRVRGPIQKDFKDFIILWECFLSAGPGRLVLNTCVKGVNSYAVTNFILHILI